MKSFQMRVVSMRISKGQEALSRSLTELRDSHDSNSFHFLMEASRYIKDAITFSIKYEKIYQIRGGKHYGRKKGSKNVRGETP